MQQRPIQVLVNALRELGAEIEYIINDGYPPLRITGHKLDVYKRQVYNYDSTSKPIPLTTCTIGKIVNCTLQDCLPVVPYWQVI